MSKRYRLKKDLPGVSAGVELVPTSAMAYGYLTQGQWVHLEWVNDIIRANPDWFEEIKEEPKEVFTWTDELVLMLADLAHHNGYHRFNERIVDLFDEVKKQASGSGYKFSDWIINHVKSSHKEEKTTPLSKERIKVYNVKKVNEKYDLADPDYVFAVSKSIPEDKLPAIKQAIESALNNDDSNFWYEIQRYTDGAIKSVTEHKFTQQQMDKAREDAFNAARDVDDGIYSRGIAHPSYLQHFFAKYPTCESYLNSLKK